MWDFYESVDDDSMTSKSPRLRLRDTLNNKLTFLIKNPKNLFSYGPMSIPPGTPSEGEGEGALSKKKNRPFSCDWLGVQTIPWGGSS